MENYQQTLEMVASNPMVMTIVATLIVIMIIVFSNCDKLMAAFYIFVALGVIFHLHNSILINELNRDKVMPISQDAFRPVVEGYGERDVAMPNIRSEAPKTIYNIPQPVPRNYSIYEQGPSNVAGSGMRSAQPAAAPPEPAPYQSNEMYDTHEYI
jgi:hypothetical protein